jgi:hypothetical protein
MVSSLASPIRSMPTYRLGRNSSIEFRSGVEVSNTGSESDRGTECRRTSPAVRASCCAGHPEPMSRSNCRPVSMSTIGRLRCGELSGVPAVAQRVLGQIPGDVRDERSSPGRRCRARSAAWHRAASRNAGPGRCIAHVDATVQGGGAQLAPQAPAAQLQALPTERVKFTSSVSKPVTSCRPALWRPQADRAQARQLDVGPLVVEPAVRQRIVQGLETEQLGAQVPDVVAVADGDAARQERGAGGLRALAEILEVLGVADALEAGIDAGVVRQLQPVDQAHVAAVAAGIARGPGRSSSRRCRRAVVGKKAGVDGAAVPGCSGSGTAHPGRGRGSCSRSA